MIDPNHLYTLHPTYTGAGCAICGKGPESHDLTVWLVNGEKKVLTDDNVSDTMQRVRIYAESK